MLLSNLGYDRTESQTRSLLEAQFGWWGLTPSYQLRPCIAAYEKWEPRGRQNYGIYVSLCSPPASHKHHLLKSCSACTDTTS